jgi:hypothetical protein
MFRHALVALSMAFAVSSGLAQAPAPPPGEDWVSLFNGRDLAGWVEVGKEKWTVEEGVIHGQALTTEYGYLKTAKLYKDFHQGLQFEVDCTINKHTGGIYGDGREWIVWPAPENETVVRLGDWNEYLLKVEGNRYIARLNGVQIVDFTDPKPRSFDGAIALQLHAGGHGNMKFKDVYIRDLTRR